MSIDNGFLGGGRPVRRGPPAGGAVPRADQRARGDWKETPDLPRMKKEDAKVEDGGVLGARHQRRAPGREGRGVAPRGAQQRQVLEAVPPAAWGQDGPGARKNQNYGAGNAEWTLT
jgi:hypothetical protein